MNAGRLNMMALTAAMVAGKVEPPPALTELAPRTIDAPGHRSRHSARDFRLLNSAQIAAKKKAKRKAAAASRRRNRR